MGLDPSLVVVEHRANRQVLLQSFERLFHGDELNVVLPQQGGIIFGEVSLTKSDCSLARRGGMNARTDAVGEARQEAGS
jgi:hypothetical protein